MNWQVKKPVLLLGLAFTLALFFSSCEESLITDTIKLVPNESDSELKSVEIPLDFTQAAFNSSVISSNNFPGSLNQVMFGSNLDPEIGDTKLSAYSKLLLPTTFIRDSVDNATIVDVKFMMRFKNLYGDEFQQGQDIIVHQLSEELTEVITRLDTGYLKLKDTFAIQPTRISEVNNSILLPSVYNLDDGTTSVEAKSIPLTNSFGQYILDGIMDPNLKTVDFAEYLKGVKITTDGSINALQGLEIGEADSYIEVVYRNANKDLNDTLKLTMSSTSFTSGQFQPSGLMPANYSNNTSFQLNDTDQLYFNQLLAIYPRLSINNYIDFIDTIQYMLINKAELVIDDSQFRSISTNFEGLLLPNGLLPYFIEADSILKNNETHWGIQANFSSSGIINDQTGANNLTILLLDEEESKISGDISFFLQEIFQDPSFWNLDRDILLTGQFLPKNEVPFLKGSNFVMRSFRKFRINKSAIKLKIYYTTFEN